MSPSYTACRYSKTVAEQQSTDGDTASETDTATDIDTATETESDTVCTLPAQFQWSASDALIYPTENLLSLKEPSIIYYNSAWHMYATTKDETDWSINYLSFSDWNEAGDAAQFPVSNNENLTGYKTSPQFFFFSPKSLWYLVYQTPEPSYSTSIDITNVENWSEATQFMSMPILNENGDTGGIDYWIICDETDCYIFFTNLDGVLYRARTSKTDFPDGFDETAIEVVMTYGQYELFQGVNVYKIEGADQYLLIANAINGNVGRYLAAWTATSLDGEWTELAASAENAFASIDNVSGADWALDGINAGELLRTNEDESMTISACNLQFVYHGLIQEGESDGLNEYALGLLTQRP